MSKLRPFCMPKWGIEMTEGTIAEWMIADGARISKGDVICLIETAKITNEVEAERDGVLLKIVESAGDDAIPVGALLAVIGDEVVSGDEISAFVDGFVPSGGGGDEDSQAEAKLEAAEAPKPKKAAKKRTKIETNRPISPKALALAEEESVDLDEITGSGRDGRITYQDVHQHLRPVAKPSLRGTTELPAEDRAVFASPLARRIAAIHNIDLSEMDGTGPRGRISKADVMAQVDQAGTAAAIPGAPFVPIANQPRIEPFDKIRKIVAQRLTAAKQEIPHFYLRVSVQADEMLALRKTANLVLGVKASVNDYIVMASAKALAQHPEVNVQLHGEELHHFPHADVAVAVASPKGLVTPIVRQADRMRIDQLSQATSTLVEKAREGRLSYEDLDGGTFTVSNLGMFGIDGFDAIINPPQGAILAVGKAKRQPVETEDGDIAFATQIEMTLSVDHRAIDGAAGAQFLATLKSLIENPEELFA